MTKIIYRRLKKDLDISSKCFTQFSAGTTKNVSASLVKDYSYRGEKYNLIIYSARIINTMEGVSIEGQCLTGKKLTIVGSIDLKLTFSNKRCKNEREILCVSIPFSTFIILPKDEEDENEEGIHCIYYNVEDIDVAPISCDKIFISAMLFMKYGRTAGCIAEENEHNK